jgi:hypothetical protein
MRLGTNVLPLVLAEGLGHARVIVASVADLALATVLAGIQVTILWSLRTLFTSNHDMLYVGSPISLLLGPAWFVLFRRTGKSRPRFLLDVGLAAVLLLLYVASFLSIGNYAPTRTEILELLVFVAPAAAEALGLIFAEKLLRKAFLRG